MQGASAIQRILNEHRQGKLSTFVVWEPVLPTDWFSPSTATLKRVSDSRAQQYWDKGRLVSKSMGERDRSSAIWDWVGVYAPDAVWESAPPKPAFGDGPVVDVVPAFTKTLESLAVLSR